VPVLEAARERTARAARELIVIGSVCGTTGDPQGLAGQEAQLSAAGMLLAPSNARAARLALLVAREAAAATGSARS
jgi:FdrA protein